MSGSTDLFGIAAHLHVLLRRKTGRVTDTEWMAVNAEYAREIARVARRAAEVDGHAELLPWAEKLELALAARQEPARRPLLQAAGEALRAGQVPLAPPPAPVAATDPPPPLDAKYVGRLR